MSAISTARVTPRHGNQAVPARMALPMAADAVIQVGTIVVVTNSTGYAESGKTGTGLTTKGVAVPKSKGSAFPYDNTGGANGALKVEVEQGVFEMENSAGGDAITFVEAGKNAVCYLVDNQTVAKTDGTGTRSKAGIVWDVLSNGKVAVLFTSFPI